MGKAGKFRPIDIEKLHRESQGATRGFRNDVFNHPMKGSDFKYTTNDFLRSSGGVMEGPIAFEEDDLTIATGDLDLTNADTVKVRGRIRVLPETGTTDTLNSISAGQNEMRGQVLILMGDAGDIITITDDGTVSGDQRAILCPNGTDFSLTGPNTVLMFYDESISKWIIVGESGGTTDNIAEGNSMVEVLDPDVGVISFFVDGIVTPKMALDATNLLMNVDLDMNGNSIDNVNIIQGAGGITDQFITGVAVGWQYRVDSGDSHEFQDPSGLLCSIADDLTVFRDEMTVRAASGFMAFMTGTTSPTTLGDASNVGSMGAPYKADTTDTPSATTLNNWFGDQNGCFGFQFDDDAPDVFKLWVKLNGTWHFKTIDDA